MTNHYTDVCEATIKSLRQQLAAKDERIAKLRGSVMKLHAAWLDACVSVRESEDFCKDEMARSAKHNAKLRQQVTLLRDAIEAIWNDAESAD